VEQGVDMSKTSVFASVVGASITLILWSITFLALATLYQGGYPWLPTLLAAFLCPLVGGIAGAWTSQTGGTAIGAVSGGAAGVIVLLAAVIASNAAPNTTLAGVLAVAVGAIAGGLGGCLMRIQRKSR